MPLDETAQGVYAIAVTPFEPDGRLDAKSTDSMVDFDAHFPLIRYEQQQDVGLATRKYVQQRRGAIAHDAQCRPGIGLSATAKAEIEYFLQRVSRHDRRALLPRN